MNKQHKLKIRNLFFLFLSFAVLVGCGDDEVALKNSIKFDGKTEKIKTVYYDPSDLSNDNYELYFYTEGTDDDRLFFIQLSDSWDGMTVDLTEVDDQFEWSWYVEYNEGETEIFSGFGGSEDDFEDVVGGTLYIKLIDADQKIFEVKATVKTADGETLKIQYKGVFAAIPS